MRDDRIVFRITPPKIMNQTQKELPFRFETTFQASWKPLSKRASQPFSAPYAPCVGRAMERFQAGQRGISHRAENILTLHSSIDIASKAEDTLGVVKSDLGTVRK